MKWVLLITFIHVVLSIYVHKGLVVHPFCSVFQHIWCLFSKCREMVEQNNIFGKQLDLGSVISIFSEKHCLQNSPGGVRGGSGSPPTNMLNCNNRNSLLNTVKYIQERMELF